MVLTLLYPLAIWFGHGRVAPRWLALLLLLAAVTRLHAPGPRRAAAWLVAAAMLLAVAAVWGNVLLPLKLYPVLVSLAMLAAFASTLVFPPSMIERLARRREPDLPAAAVGYTRRVTQVWCGFFIVNGAIAFGTAVWASEVVWSLYTGVIAYGLMGTLFAGEYLCRIVVKRHWQRRAHA